MLIVTAVFLVDYSRRVLSYPQSTDGALALETHEDAPRAQDVQATRVLGVSEAMSPSIKVYCLFQMQKQGQSST